MSPELIEARIKLSNAIEKERRHRHNRWCEWCDRLQADVLLARGEVMRLEGRPTGDEAA